MYMFKYSVSEAQLVLTPATAAVSVSECASSGTVISYTKTEAGATGAVTYALTTQDPDSVTKKFAVAADGALTTLTSAASTFDATTQLTYVVTIT